MRLKFEQLPGHVRHSLRPVYLVAGDEPLQWGEALDCLRKAARVQGYHEREVLESDAQFDWNSLALCAANRSLFGARRVIELRLASAKIGHEGGAALVAYLQQPPPDTVLFIASPRLERTSTPPKWLQAVEREGVLLLIWPVDRAQLPAWLEQRMRYFDLQPEPGVTAWLCDQVEGNLLAAVQEIEKMRLLHGTGPIRLEQIVAATMNSARFGLFDLTQSILEGEPVRSVRILRGLRAEDTAPALILWALLREVRLLMSLSIQQRIHPGNIAALLAARPDIRERQRPLYIKTLDRISAPHWRELLHLCSEADQRIKGIIKADPWLNLEQIVLGVCGASGSGFLLGTKQL